MFLGTTNKHEVSRMIFNAKMKSGHLRISVSSVGKINCKKLCVFASSREILKLVSKMILLRTLNVMRRKFLFVRTNFTRFFFRAKPLSREVFKISKPQSREVFKI